MKLSEIKTALEKIDYTNLTQKQAGELIGTTQSDISRCCRYYGIVWPYKRRDQYGAKNHWYKDGLGRSTIERTTRIVILKSGRCLFTCEVCGFKDTKTERDRHHKDRNRSNNTPENIVVLCDSCHMKEHQKDHVRDIETGRYMA